MRKNHSKIVCIKLVHLPYLVSNFELLTAVAKDSVFVGLHAMSFGNLFLVFLRNVMLSSSSFLEF